LKGLDLVEATVLFRRQLGCTLASLAAVAVIQALGEPADAGVRALREMALGLFVVAVGALAGVTAARLARVLGLSDPWRYGFAFFPCLNLVVLAFFGAHLWPAWNAAGETPLFLLRPRRSMEARTASARAIALPTPSATGGVVTFALVVVCVSALHAGVSVVRALRSPARTGPPAASGAAPPSAETASYRPFAQQGQAAFDQASARIASPDAAGAGLGNTPEATRVAQQISDTMEREVRKSLAAYADFRPVIASGSPFRVYVHARPERAGVLMHVPRFEGLPDAARLAMMHFAWRAATAEVRSLRLVGARGVALGLRGAGPYGAVTWGELTDDVPGQHAVGPAADTTALAAFFADARIPLPLPTPRSGSAAARVLAQRGHSVRRTRWRTCCAGARRGPCHRPRWATRCRCWPSWPSATTRASRPTRSTGWPSS